MRIIKQNRTGRRILALLLSSCLLAGFVPAAYASPAGTDEGGESGLFLDKWVEETGDGNFRLVLESYATGSNDTVTTEPVPGTLFWYSMSPGRWMTFSFKGATIKTGPTWRLRQRDIWLRTPSWTNLRQRADCFLSVTKYLVAKSISTKPILSSIPPMAQRGISTTAQSVGRGFQIRTTLTS